MWANGAAADGSCAALDSEEILLVEEGLHANVTYRDPKGPGHFVRLRTESGTGTIVVTDRHLLVWAGGFKHIHVPHYHPVRQAIEVTKESPDTLCLSYDPDASGSALSGRVEVRLDTSQAEHIAGLLGRLAGGK
ncbi:MAG TPA: hypothetical protein VMU95_06230 [Trebonia sp.]|nr:hypothetical protein [Trebonia sp.]